MLLFEGALIVMWFLDRKAAKEAAAEAAVQVVVPPTS